MKQKENQLDHGHHTKHHDHYHNNDWNIFNIHRLSLFQFQGLSLIHNHPESR